jgi:hypothetical protein
VGISVRLFADPQRPPKVGISNQRPTFKRISVSVPARLGIEKIARSVGTIRKDEGYGLIKLETNQNAAERVCNCGSGRH